LVRSIVDRYLGSDVERASTSADKGGSMERVPISTPRFMAKRMRNSASLSDSDVERQAVKSRKQLRSYVIDSDSECEGESTLVTLSDSSRQASDKMRNKKAKARRQEKLEKLEGMDDSFESNRAVFTDCPTHLAFEELYYKDVDVIATMSDGWLTDMETARFRSKKINGKFSGVMKDRIICLRSVVKVLADRVKDTGDVTFLRRRNDELAMQLRESKNVELKLQSSLRDADVRAERLEREITELKKKIGRNSIFKEAKEVERTPPPTEGRKRGVIDDRTPSIADSVRNKREK